MDYIALLSAAIRLIDLHDSDRDYGASPNFSRESRPGKADGLYLDVAVHAVELLRRLDESSSRDFMSFSAIYADVKKQHPQLAEDDVLYVLNVLRRPTELFYLSHKDDGSGTVKLSEKRKTALIEKTDYADEYRLSQTGRLMVALSNAAVDVTYMRGDAYNLLHAIESYDFRNVTAFADQMVSLLRTEILDVRAALERVGRTETVDRYIERFEQYKKIITQTIEIVGKSEHALDNPTTLEEFLQWQAGPNGMDFTYESLLERVYRIRQVLLMFQRLLSELVSLIVNEKRSTVSTPSFLSYATDMVRNPLSDTKMDFLLRQWGALKEDTPFHSVLDGFGAIKVRPVANALPGIRFEDDVVESYSTLGKLVFLDRYGHDIAEAVGNGPLSLNEAIGRGWFSIDDQVVLGDLVGIFVSPDSLQLDGEIEIRVSPELTARTVTDGEFFFNDLELVLRTSYE